MKGGFKMATSIRLISATMVQEFNNDDPDFPVIENNGGIGVVAEIPDGKGRSVLVNTVINDFKIFKRDMNAFQV
jgi:hypothetical protein